MHQGILRKLVRSPLTYRALRPSLDLLLVRDENPAFKVWVRFLLDVTRKAYSHERPVIWMNAFAPVEMVYALGGVPFMPEIIAALVAYLGQSRHPIARSNIHISTDLCSFYRCAMGLVGEGYLPEPDLILSSSQLCDGANKFFQYLGREYGCPHLMLDPPYGDGPSAHGYLVEQLREVAGKASDILGCRFQEEQLSKALERSNQARAYMEEVNRLRRNHPTPLPASEGLSYVAGMNFYSPGSDWGVDFFRSLCRYLRHKVAQGRGYLPEERFRLLWLHHTRPYYRNDIFQILNERKAAVSFEEANYLYWEPADPTLPWDSLAKKMLSNVWAGPLERRLRAVESMIKDYKIDGVIHFSHWGCRQSCGGAAVIGDLLKENEVPYIVLPGDGADPDNYSPGQTRTRLEALVEMLER